MEDFTYLDKRVSRVSSTAVRIGDRMETVDAQQQRILEAKEVIKYFVLFNNNKEDPLFGRIRDKEPAELFEAADWAIKLRTVATDLRNPNLPGVEKINSKATEIQEVLLDKFDEASKQDNFITMKKYASKLAVFGSLDAEKDKSDITRHYIKKVVKAIDLPIPMLNEDYGDYDLFKNGLLEIFEVIKVCLLSKCRVAIQVFPKYKTVLDKLLEVMFTEKIGGYLNSILRARKWDGNEELNILDETYCSTLELIKDLKQTLEILLSDTRDSSGKKSEFVIE
eukprot:UN29390